MNISFFHNTVFYLILGVLILIAGIDAAYFIFLKKGKSGKRGGGEGFEPERTTEESELKYASIDEDEDLEYVEK